MTAKKSVLASVLKLTKTGPVQRELIRRDAKVTIHVLEEELTRLSEGGLILQRRSVVEAAPNQRVSMAVQAIKLGADFERICKFLEWNEFESIAAQTFEANGFSVLKNFRFKTNGKRWEIDILGCKEPLVVCVDCKHWRRGWNMGTIVKAVEAQIERTRAFADAFLNYFQKLQQKEWKSAILIPLILSLTSGPFKFHNNVPIVPVLQFQDFINELPFEVDSLTHFKKKPLKTNHNLTEFSK